MPKFKVEITWEDGNENENGEFTRIDADSQFDAMVKSVPDLFFGETLLEMMDNDTEALETFIKDCRSDYDEHNEKNGNFSFIGPLGGWIEPDGVRKGPWFEVEEVEEVNLPSREELLVDINTIFSKYTDDQIASYIESRKHLLK